MGNKDGCGTQREVSQITVESEGLDCGRSPGLCASQGLDKTMGCKDSSVVGVLRYLGDRQTFSTAKEFQRYTIGICSSILRGFADGLRGFKKLGSD